MSRHLRLFPRLMRISMSDTIEYCGSELELDVGGSHIFLLDRK